jgi:probable HAF family extracellular repeat protein
VTVAFSANPSYDAILIDAMEGYESKAFGLNNQGDVVGRYYIPGVDGDLNRTAFFWDFETQTSHLLDPLLIGAETSAFDINDNGIISGFSTDSTNRIIAARWNNVDQSLINTSSFAKSNFFAASNTSLRSFARDINSSGMVAGFSYVPNQSNYNLRSHAFVFDDTTTTDLGTLTTLYPSVQNGYSVAYDVNDNNVVVGSAASGKNVDDNWIYLPFVNNLNNDLGNISLKTDLDREGEWHAVSINNAGLIGGHVMLSNVEKYAYYWDTYLSDPVPLALPDEFQYSEIYSINSSGLMVGVMWNDFADQYAFYVDENKTVYSLNSLLIDIAQDQWHLQFARDINDYGQIVGFGQYNEQNRGYLLTVTPEPLSCVLFSLGLVTVGFFKRKL